MAHLMALASTCFAVAGSCNEKPDVAIMARQPSWLRINAGIVFPAVCRRRIRSAQISGCLALCFSCRDIHTSGLCICLSVQFYISRIPIALEEGEEQHLEFCRRPDLKVQE